MFNDKQRVLMGILILGLMVFITGCGNSTTSNNNNSGNDNINGPLKEAIREKESYDELIIDKSTITETAKFFPVTVDGVKMEVIAVRATDGTIRTAFNACQVCASSGRGYYIQKGHKLVCQNCGNQFDIDEIELTRNGCNPAPIEKLDKSEDDKFVTISKETFIKNMDLFNY